MTITKFVAELMTAYERAYSDNGGIEPEIRFSVPDAGVGVDTNSLEIQQVEIDYNKAQQLSFVKVYLA